MARESAQMAGQLAFRGRAPQLKLPHFSPFLFSLLQLKLLAHNFSRLAGLYLSVHDVKGQAEFSERVWGWGGGLEGMSCPWINGAIGISGNSTEASKVSVAAIN